MLLCIVTVVLSELIKVSKYEFKCLNLFEIWKYFREVFLTMFTPQQCLMTFTSGKNLFISYIDLVFMSEYVKQSHSVCIVQSKLSITLAQWYYGERYFMCEECGFKLQFAIHSFTQISTFHVVFIATQLNKYVFV